MSVYEIANKIAQRFYFGAVAHHPHLANFFELIDMPELADEQRKNAINEFKKRLYIDKMIVDETGKYPLYGLPNLPTIANVIANIPPEKIKEDEKAFIKKAIEIGEVYEKETLKLLEELKEKAKEFKDSKFPKFLANLVSNIREELEQIEANKEIMEKLEYDKQKIKGEHNMRSNYGMRGEYGMEHYPQHMPHHMAHQMPFYPMQNPMMPQQMPYHMMEHHMNYPMMAGRGGQGGGGGQSMMESMRSEYGENPMGFEMRRGVPGSGRGGYRSDFLPFMEDDMYDMEARRGVPGSGRGRR